MQSAVRTRVLIKAFLLLLFLFLFSFLLPPFSLFSSPSSLLIQTRVLIFFFFCGVGFCWGVGCCWVLLWVLFCGVGVLLGFHIGGLGFVVRGFGVWFWVWVGFGWW